MKKNMNIGRRIFAAIIALVLAVTILPSADLSAAVEKVANASKFAKKLKKNTLSKEPNLDSGLLTLGYATYKIQKAIESDSNAYVYYGTSIYEAFEAAGEEIKFVASSKKQRAALKWGVSSCLVSWIDKTHPERNIQLNAYESYCGLFDGNDLLTRRDLIELMGRVTALFYSGRMQVIYHEIDVGLDYYASQGDGIFDQTAIYKGIVMFPEIPSPEDIIDVDEPATKEDLARVLKNLKIASKYYTAKLVRRDQPLEQYTAKDAKKDVERLNKYLAKKTGKKNMVELSFDDSRGGLYYDFAELLEISALSSISFNWGGDGLPYWYIGIGFSRLGYDDFHGADYNPIDIDVVGTVINIFKKRL